MLETTTLQTVGLAPCSIPCAAAQLSLKVAAPYKPSTAAAPLRPVLFAASQLPGDTKDTALCRQAGRLKQQVGRGLGRAPAKQPLFEQLAGGPFPSEFTVRPLPEAERPPTGRRGANKW